MKKQKERRRPAGWPGGVPAAAFVLATMLALDMHAASRARRALAVEPVLNVLEPAACAMTPPAPLTCSDGGLSLAANEVDAIVRAAAKSLSNRMTIAVVDRAGRVLALYETGRAAGDRDLAIGVARTAAFFSHNQAPLSSRTVRFISGIHFPPGITNTPSAALYGIENTNRGCDFNVTFNTDKCIPRAGVQRHPLRSVRHERLRWGSSPARSSRQRRSIERKRGRHPALSRHRERLPRHGRQALGAIGVVA
jgi:hypothetical protein